MCAQSYIWIIIFHLSFLHYVNFIFSLCFISIFHFIQDSFIFYRFSFAKIHKNIDSFMASETRNLVDIGKCSIDPMTNVFASIYMYCSTRHNFLCVLPITRRPTPYSMSLRQSLDPLVAAHD